MLIYKKVIPVIEVGVTTLIILFIPHDPQSISCVNLSLAILLNIIWVKIQALIQNPKSLNSHCSRSSRSSHASSHSRNSSSSKKSSLDSHVSNPSYLSVLERPRTAEHADILVKQAEERTQRKLKLL